MTVRPGRRRRRPGARAGAGTGAAAGDRVDWAATLAAYEAVRTEHTRSVTTTSRAWGNLWHLDGLRREQRNTLLRRRDTYDYGFVDWLYGPTALFPQDEPAMFRPIPLPCAPGVRGRPSRISR